MMLLCAGSGLLPAFRYEFHLPAASPCRIMAIALTGLLLSACASQIAGYAAAGREEIENFNDSTGEGLKAAPCAITVGAYHRIASPQERAAIACLCGGPCAD